MGDRLWRPVKGSTASLQLTAVSLFTDEDGEDGPGPTGDYDDEEDEEEDEEGSEGGEVGLSIHVNRADQVGNTGFSLQVSPPPAQTQACSLSHDAPGLSQAGNSL